MKSEKLDWLRIYHSLPYPLRVFAASARGFYLHRWRYGQDTERLVEEALERETWSLQQWKTWQEERLAYVLHRAATRVPYYREQWAARRRRGDKASWEYLENWPILEKEPLRQNPMAFIADDCHPRRMYHVHTSGTTGKPISLWFNREVVRKWYALFEARWRRWYGVSRHDRWAILGGQLVTPVSQCRPPFWVWNAGLNQLYMSSYHLSPDFIPHYLDALQKYRVKYLYGYTSSLYALANEALRLGRQDLRMAVAITNAEPLSSVERGRIAHAFQCPVRETYGMAEMVTGASECEEGRLHLWPEAGWVEVLDGDQSAPSGETGDLVCTGLLNADMPLIRYRVGDRGTLAPPDDRCSCGRTLPLLVSIEGRIDEVLYTPDGRRIGRLDPVFKADLPIREAQIIQETLNRVRVRCVLAPGFSHEAESTIIERVRERMGSIEVIVEPVDKIPRSANGKFRAVICQVSAEERQRLMNVGMGRG